MNKTEFKAVSGNLMEQLRQIVQEFPQHRIVKQDPVFKLVGRPVALALIQTSFHFKWN